MMIKSRHVSLRALVSAPLPATDYSIMPAPGAAGGPQPRRFWFPVICDAAILTIGIGARQSFGLFQKPIAAARKVGRELWSLARISQRGRCIGPVDLRKSCCKNGLSRRQGIPDANRV